MNAALPLAALALASFAPRAAAAGASGGQCSPADGRCAGLEDSGLEDSVELLQVTQVVQLQREVVACADGEPLSTSLTLEDEHEDELHIVKWQDGMDCDDRYRFDPNGVISQTNRLLGNEFYTNIPSTREQCEAQCLQYLSEPNASAVTPDQGPITLACCRWWPTAAGTHPNACNIYGQYSSTTKTSSAGTDAAVNVCRPTGAPTSAPTGAPTSAPTAGPTSSPTAGPTSAPTGAPTAAPTSAPTAGPTSAPTAGPTSAPTAGPTSAPTGAPTAGPTSAPTAGPTSAPTAGPTSAPTAATAGPTSAPTSAPTAGPTSAPTAGHTSAPTGAPTAGPTSAPTVPTSTPTGAPTTAVTGDPHVTNVEGHRFDINRVGVHELLRLPRRPSSPSQDTRGGALLEVSGTVESEKPCAESFVRRLDLSGLWLQQSGPLVLRAGGASEGGEDAIVLQVNGSRVGRDAFARDARLQGVLQVTEPTVGRGKQNGAKVRRDKLLNVQMRFPGAALAVDWIHREVPGSSLNHLDFHVTDLSKHMDVGGILGMDDHTLAASPSSGCTPSQNLMDVRGGVPASLLSAAYEHE